MVRKCQKLRISDDGKRAIYIDKENKDEILAYIRQDARHKKKFRFIAAIILGGFKKREVYDKEDVNKHAKDVTAMKFFKGQENGRIYCKEMNGPNGVFIVIAAILHERKKSEGLSSKELEIIKKIGGYNYEIEE